MVAAGGADRVLVGSRQDGLTGLDLRSRAASGGKLLAELETKKLIYLGGNQPAFAVALFSAAAAHCPFLPLNYRLSDIQLTEILQRHEGVVVTDNPERVEVIAPNHRTLTIDEFMTRTSTTVDGNLDPADMDDIAVLLMTSGTTAAPKSAVLRHHHLTSYVVGSVEFASAEPTDSTIVSVPPYHIAAVANLLSNLYAGRRIVYLDQFTPQEWLGVVRSEAITNAMVVPTMLSRIVDELEGAGETGPSTLRSLSYGGAKVSARVIESALKLFPDTGFVNAYGLTETSSSIAVLGPDDHREAVAAEDPAVRARLGSVGRALPGVAIEVRRPDGTACSVGEVGEIMVRGAQVAGEYLEAGSTLAADGWFSTRDRGHLDADGYLFVEGRADDTIIRGGENIAPAEIEDVLARHEAVRECVVAGVPDDEWGHRIAAYVVLRAGSTPSQDEIKDFVRNRLRSSKTPDIVVFLDELPTTATGKILRRNLVEQTRRTTA
ncbi:AMP-dependent synthetase and ligase [Rhodococcus ruber BKS 20-38]|uniref:AMP-dependent synthetase and ligase n=2 Tax=Rhodococcus ruber TaxID=1830 RepID=M2ZJ49_9NOCA|nr:AMP-dependent synthetase and ligase [Rhodococcus ruber BKS 20-38]